MKKSVLFALAICVSLLVFESCESAKEESAEGVKTEVLAENKESVQMKVDGMVCAMGCAKYIQEQVADLNGVVASNVNFEEGSAVFEFDKSVLSATEIEQIRQVRAKSHTMLNLWFEGQLLYSYHLLTFSIS